MSIYVVVMIGSLDFFIESWNLIMIFGRGFNVRSGYNSFDGSNVKLINIFICVFYNSCRFIVRSLKKFGWMICEVFRSFI